MPTMLKRFVQSESGNAVEYAVMVVAMAGVVVITVNGISMKVALSLAAAGAMTLAGAAQ